MFTKSQAEFLAVETKLDSPNIRFNFDFFSGFIFNTKNTEYSTFNTKHLTRNIETSVSRLTGRIKITIRGVTALINAGIKHVLATASSWSIVGFLVIPIPDRVEAATSWLRVRPELSTTVSPSTGRQLVSEFALTSSIETLRMTELSHISYVGLL